MRVLGVHDKDSEIRCFSKPTFFVMQRLFEKYPKEYGKCYFNNLETLKLIKVDDFFDDKVTSNYNGLGNVIMYSKNNSLAYELFRVASYDRERNIFAFDNHIGIEEGLITGMTEYLFQKTYDLPHPYQHPFETFCIEMLEDIPGLFKPYFIPNHDEFIGLFPNKRVIYSLMYALNVYHENCSKYHINNQKKMAETIKSVIDSLITIEVLRTKDPDILARYGEKFMAEISCEEIERMMISIFPKYHNYANKQINIRIRRRGE